MEKDLSFVLVYYVSRSDTTCHMLLGSLGDLLGKVHTRDDPSVRQLL